MSFNFINNIGNEPLKKDKVVNPPKNNKPKYDSNNPSRDLDIALENLKKNIVLKYKNWGGHNVDGFNISFRYGRKFIKVLEGTRVWGFVAIGNDSHKNIPYNRGDTFKPAILIGTNGQAQII
jgi:hypothetical protein